MSETHDHAIRGRFHAFFLSSTENVMHRLYGERKAALFADLPLEFVELGPGAGGNFRYYPPGARIVGIEPNLRMHARLRARAVECGIALDLRGLRGESVDLPDASTACVVCTLVLCSVDDPARVLFEARRILRPGGRLLFIEHVAAERGSWLRWLQDCVQPPWSWCFEGCRPNRESWLALEAAGFSSVELERFSVRSPFIHTAPQMAGIAIR